METTAQNTLETEIILQITDPVLLSLCEAELCAMQIPLRSIDPSEDHASANAVVIVDLDAHDLPEEVPLCRYRIGISRNGRALPRERTANFDAILHRPFLLEDFRSAILRAREAPTYEKIPTRRSMTAHRVKRERGIRPHGTNRSLLCGNAEIPLTPAEMTVFLALYRAHGETVTREALSALLHSESGSNLPDVHVCALRKKLTPHGADASIQTVRGKGYRLLSPATARK